MGLPDRDSASTWGGKLLVDRDGTEIGTCTQIFLDDATGLPEWAQADLSGGPGVVPLVDASASGDRVRVAVRRTEVEDAPRVDDPLHISQDEEERLYRHYGITFSTKDSETVLPVAGPVGAGPVDSEPVAAEPGPAAPASTEEVVPPAPTPSVPTSSAPTSAVPSTPGPTLATAPPTPTSPGTEPSNASGGARRGLLPALAAGAVGVLAVVAAAVFWWRRQHQLPPTRKELLAARARAASLALGARTDQVRTSAAPLLATGRRMSAAAAQRAAVEAGVAAERAAVQARAAALQAAALAAGYAVRARGGRGGGDDSE